MTHRQRSHRIAFDSYYHHEAKDAVPFGPWSENYCFPDKVSISVRNNTGKRIQNANVTTKYRGKYFLYFRRERTILAKLAEMVPRPFGSRRERMIIREVYYRVLPGLFTKLFFWKDQLLLRQLEKFYNLLLNTIGYCRGSSSRVERLEARFKCSIYFQRRFPPCAKDLLIPAVDDTTAVASARTDHFDGQLLSTYLDVSSVPKDKSLLS